MVYIGTYAVVRVGPRGMAMYLPRSYINDTGVKIGDRFDLFRTPGEKRLTCVPTTQEGDKHDNS